MLISVMVLGILTLGFVVLGIAANMQASQSSSVMENKAMASSVATACMEHALGRIGSDAGYAGNETLAIGDQTCTIRPVTVDSGTWILETFAQANDQYARYRVILTSRVPIIVRSWAEIAGF